MKTVYFNLILAFSFLLLHSCNKEEIQVDTPDASSSYNKEFLESYDPFESSDTKRGSQNEYEYVGQYHNKFLTTMLKEGKTKDDLATIQMNVNEIAKADNDFQKYMRNESALYQDVDYLEKGLNDRDNHYQKVLNDLNFEPEAESILIDLFAEMTKERSDNNEITYEDFEKTISGYESRAQNLKGNDRARVLSTLAIAENSTYFWYNYLNTTKENVSGKKRKWWKWLIVGAADAVGGAIGSSAGPATLVSCAVAASTYASSEVDNLD